MVLIQTLLRPCLVLVKALELASVVYPCADCVL